MKTYVCIEKDGRLIPLEGDDLELHLQFVNNKATHRTLESMGLKGTIEGEEEIQKAHEEMLARL